MERFARIPALTITKWFPTWPEACHPAFWKTLTASLPEMLASLPIQLYGYDDLLAARLFGKL
jgi:hypothetical protein